MKIIPIETKEEWLKLMLDDAVGATSLDYEVLIVWDGETFIYNDCGSEVPISVINSGFAIIEDY